MTRLPGPGDFSPPDEPEHRCECGASLEGLDPCRHDRCNECRDSYSCCEECSVCHQLTDEYEVDEVDEGTDPVCVDCAVAAMELAEDLAERDLVALEAKGDEMREGWR